MRSPLLFFCLVAAAAAADQKADSAPMEIQAVPIPSLLQADSVPTGSQPVPIPVLLTYDELNAMTNEQRTAYANTIDQAQAQSNVDSISVASRGGSELKTADNQADHSATVSRYNRGESGYKSVDNGYISDITRFNRGNGRSDRGYISTSKPGSYSYSNDGYRSGNGQYQNGYNDGKSWIGRGENGYGRGEIGDRSGENGYGRDENGYRRGEEGYGKGYRSENKEESGHKSARGYSDSLPKDYPYRIIGLHGFVFEKRYSRASGLMNPITPEALSHLGYRQKKSDQIFVPPY